MKAYFFSAEFRSDAEIQMVDGVISTDIDPFSSNFMPTIRDIIANGMTPARPVEKISIKSLSPLATK